MGALPQAQRRGGGRRALGRCGPCRCHGRVDGRAGRAWSLQRFETVGAFGAVVAGVLWHFVYDWSGGSPLVAAIAPANESVWEHLKLVVVPVVALGLVEARWMADHPRLWWAKCVEVASACTFIVAFFYTYTGALGVHSLVLVDILTFVGAVAGGQLLSYRVISSPRRAPVPFAVSVTALVLLVVLFAALTFVPPHLPLFQETATGAYGPT